MFKIGGVAVVAVWLAMAGFLAVRGYYPEAVIDKGRALEAREQWMGIYVEKRKIGYAMSKVDKTADGYSVSEEMDASLSMQGIRQDMRTTINSKVDQALTLKQFDFSLKSQMADMVIKGEVAGKVLRLVVSTAGRDRTVELPLADTPHLTSDLELYLLREGLEAGKKFRLPFFDPASLSQQYMDLEVEAKEDLKLGDRLVPVYRVKESYSGITATSWISPELGTVKGEGPMGFTFLRETKEQAMSRPKGGYGTADIVALVSIPAKGEVPDPRNTGYLKARVSGADLTNLDIEGGRQAFSDGVVSVTRERLDALAKAALPVKDPDLQKYLKPSPFIQSDDPNIKAKALEVLAGETDALKAAEKLNAWVNRSVRKQPSAGIPSAVEVLGNLSGDCNEHTVLYTALARSVGLPARVAAGIVMVDGRFYYHAWPEVYAGGWVSVDPTFGQFPSDATHIRLVEGELDKQMTIIRVVGKMSVEVLESR